MPSPQTRLLSLAGRGSPKHPRLAHVLCALLGHRSVCRRMSTELTKRAQERGNARVDIGIETFDTNEESNVQFVRLKWRVVRNEKWQEWHNCGLGIACTSEFRQAAAAGRG